MKGALGVDLLRPEGAGIFFFIEEFDPADTDPVIVEVELLGIIHRMTKKGTLFTWFRNYFLDRDVGTFAHSPVLR